MPAAQQNDCTTDYFGNDKSRRALVQSSHGWGLAMEIKSERSGDLTKIVIAGRLDAYWSDHLTRALDEHLRQGNDRVHLYMQDVDYISSLGIRALVSAYKKFKAVNGLFSIAEPTGNVRKVLEMAGLASLLNVTPDAPPAPADTSVSSASAVPASFSQVRGQARFEVFSMPGPGMTCRAFGDPNRLDGGSFSAADCRTLPISSNSVSLGLGAFGQGFDENRSRFGEFLAVAGAASYQPGDGSNTCDTLLTEGDYVPELQALYGLNCEGAFTRLIRFELLDENESINLSEIVVFALEMAGASSVCIVLAGESAGLVGASLRRSPAATPSSLDLFGFPQVRDWISFTTERAHAHMSVVTCGVAAQDGKSPAALGPYLRPLADTRGPVGHLHSAVFRFRPLQRGAIDISSAVRPLFEHETTQAVMHLLADDRDGGEISESRLTRGVCWVSPIVSVAGGVA